MPATALAGSNNLFNGSINYGGVVGPKHTLSSVYAYENGATALPESV